MGCHALLQGIFPTQGLNPGFSHCRQIPYQLTTREAQIMTVQFSLVAQSCPTLCNPMNRSKPGLPVHHQLLEITSIKSVMPSSHLILGRPLLLLPAILPSISVFSSESILHMRWPKYWSFSFTISLSDEHPGLVSFRMDLHNHKKE